ILHTLENELGYKTSWKVFDSLEFGLPQSRKRIFIVGTKDEKIDLSGNEPRFAILESVLEKGLPTLKSDFIDKLMSHFSLEDLYGKSIKDKRGGDNNIHSWDIEIKGSVSEQQALILNQLFKQRRKKQWAEEIGIDWMDGMALTLGQINTFIDLPQNELKSLLEDLTSKGYLKFEHPKKLVKIQ